MHDRAVKRLRHRPDARVAAQRSTDERHGASGAGPCACMVASSASTSDPDERHETVHVLRAPSGQEPGWGGLLLGTGDCWSVCAATGHGIQPRPVPTGGETAQQPARAVFVGRGEDGTTLFRDERGEPHVALAVTRHHLTRLDSGVARTARGRGDCCAARALGRPARGPRRVCGVAPLRRGARHCTVPP